MPPARRPRGAHHAAPYCRGWLKDDGPGSDDDDGEALPILDDALSPILARLPSAADVARLVAKDGAMLSRALPPLSCLTLGFLHQEDAGTTVRRRRTSAAAAQPCFVPTAAAGRLIGLRGPSRIAVADAVLGLGNDRGVFEHARPVAACNGWLVLELRQERYTDGLKLCVCNPIRGDMAMLPPLAGTDKPGDYACALYTALDLGMPRPLSSFFRLLIVYNRRAALLLLGQSIMVDGVAYWYLRLSAFAVRVDTPEPTEVLINLPRGWQLLGVDPDGKLIFIDAGLYKDFPNAAVGSAVSYQLAVATRSVFCPGSGDDDCSGEWKRIVRTIKLEQLKVLYAVPPFGEGINLRWFCEKSGTLLFTLGEGTSSPGAFVLNIATEHIEKVADGIDCDSWRNLVGYEMDGAAYLASMSPR
ncbi:hypothetical protein PVAP13_9KG324200 [Panicum virgatum]|uniref:Uncharacterized protein n=1 Tax=Panicum virgatum TaxID=38727 RepID=A0A8T0NU09_PANVG|nr:hypothetical protein PVAP13_9KG324200 [Panicum virgatum]